MDDAEIDEFARLYQQFLTHVVHRARPADAGESLIDRLETFFGTDPAGLPVVTEEFRGFEHATVQIAIDWMLEAPGVDHELIGVGGPGRAHHSLTELIEAARLGMFRIGAVDYTSVPVSIDEERTCVRFGIYLIDDGDTRLAVVLRGESEQHGQAAMLEVIAHSTDPARAWLARLRAERTRHNTLRGQVLSFAPSRFSPGTGPVRFIRRPDLDRDEVIMPGGVLERVERQVVGVAEYRERLAAEERHLKRGVLLYGPPGTGKTHTVRYLTGALREFTVVLLAGPSIEYVGEACALARALQPALIVLEDCDLVAGDRSFSPGSNPLLFTVLDEMDGLGSDSDVCFLLTTNRVDLLETALAQRPGRVDLAVEMPLPDDDGRRRLLALCAAGIELTRAEEAAIVEQTEGVPASFMKELARRATLTAAARDEATTGAYLVAAMEELMADQEALTRRLLGIGVDGVEFDDAPSPAVAPAAGWFAYAPTTGSRYPG